MRKSMLLSPRLKLFCKDCVTKYCSAGLVLVSLWLGFVVLVSLRSYGHIPDPFH